MRSYSLNKQRKAILSEVSKFVNMKISIAFLFVLFSGVASAQTTIFLVRHAEKVDSSRDPELSLRGKARAIRLMELLSETGIDHIYATDYIRTRNTAKPLAEKLDLFIASYRPFEAQLLETLTQKMDGKQILVVGHSNTIPDLVNRLIDKKAYEQLPDEAYSNLFVVTIIEGKATHYVLTF